MLVDAVPSVLTPTCTPMPLASGLVPERSVPMKLPATVLAEAPPVRRTPAWSLPGDDVPSCRRSDRRSRWPRRGSARQPRCCRRRACQRSPFRSVADGRHCPTRAEPDLHAVGVSGDDVLSPIVIPRVDERPGCRCRCRTPSCRWVPCRASFLRRRWCRRPGARCRCPCID